MRVIVGLGNPGVNYAPTRHNFGFMVADKLAENFGVTFTLAKKFNSEIAEITEGTGEKVLLVKPQTFMNLSGQAVQALAQFYKIEPEHIWVIADDLDLALGKIRIRKGGETGGHHGLESLAQELKTNDFWRIRLGIRGEFVRHEHLDNKVDTTRFVTEPFLPSEQAMVERVVAQAAAFIREGIEKGELKAHTHETDGMDEHAGDQI